MKILYIGTETGTSGHRMNALKRLGHEVIFVDPRSYLPGGRPIIYWMKYLGSVGIAAYVSRRLEADLSHLRFDCTWVDNGALISPGSVRNLKKHSRWVLCYNVDDPFGDRDFNLWHQYRRAVPEYDLLVVVREENVQEGFQAGAKQVKLVFRAADEVAHSSFPIPEMDRAQWKSEVLFVGTAFPERGAFMSELISRGVPLSIFGDRWNRLREWPALKSAWRGPGLYSDDLYAKAITSSKVCLGLLSKGNRDLHTTRSMEIPSLGAVFCGERTKEHDLLYRDRQEAVFWSTAAECAEVCNELLNDVALRASIAQAGNQRFRANNWTNMRVAQDVLAAVAGR